MIHDNYLIVPNFHQDTFLLLSCCYVSCALDNPAMRRFKNKIYHSGSEGVDMLRDLV